MSYLNSNIKVNLMSVYDETVQVENFYGKIFNDQH